MSTRREFVVQAGGLVLAVTLSRCGYGDSGTNTTNNGKTECTVASSNSHSHNCSAFDPDKPAPINVTLSGSGHVHTLVLGATELTQLATVGGQVTLDSQSASGHAHSVTVKRIA